MTVSASDPNGSVVTYSLIGTVDGSLFSIDMMSGALSFRVAPDFEVPKDSDRNNIYNLQVVVSDGALVTTQNLAITVTNVDEAPYFTSGGSVSMAENTTAVMSVNASDAESGSVGYSLTGTADDVLFSIDSASGALRFIAAPDFESPGDSNGDNTYNLQVTASDGSLSTTLNMAVMIADVDEAPQFTSGNSASLAENTTAVMAVNASDAEGGSVSYSLTGTVDDALFTIDAASGALSFLAAPDFESPGDSGGDNTYDIQVTASDGASNSTQSIAVTITNAAEAPQFTSGSSTSLAENTTAVMAVSANDVDGDSVSYSLTGTVDDALFTIDATSGALSFLAAPDFEIPGDSNGDNIYNLQVTASDGVLSTAQSLAITVVNANDVAPNFNTGTAVSLAENTTAVMTVSASDADGDSVSYSLTGTVDDTLFSLDAASGALSFLAAPDFESPGDSGADNIYNLQVTASDGTLTTTQNIAVTITNVDEAAQFTSGTSVSVVENTTAVMTVNASDPESGSVSYTLTGTVDDALFAIDAASGALSFLAAPDFESPGDSGGDNIYDLEVTASDGTQSVSQGLVVTVTNANDIAPVFSTSTAISVIENSAAVMTVRASDADGDSMSYSLTGTVDDGLFSIDAVSGALSFLAAPDFESPGDNGTDNIYNLQLTASDGVFSTSQDFAITVVNVNDLAPVFSTANTASMPENSASVMNVSASDADGNSVSYSLTGTVDDTLFSLDAASGALSFLAAPDFESPGDSGADNIYNLQVTASDGTLTTTQNIAVTITNVDEAAQFTSGASVSVVENTTAVMTVNASDPESGSVSYTLTGTVDDALFAIDAASGALSFLAAPDFESPGDSGGDNIYDLEVTASDGTQSVSQGLVVTVTNANDIAPVFSTSTAISVIENSTAVMTVRASDADGDSVSYSLSGMVDDALFSIDAVSGTLSFISAPDFEVPTDAGGDNIYDLLVAATDGKFTTTQLISVTVTDMLELQVVSSEVKTLTFSWSPYAGASYYKLLVNPDGVSGFTQQGTDIVTTSADVIIPVHLTDWINASYMLEAYDGANNLLASSDAMPVTSLMLSSIGYVKASNNGMTDYFGLPVALSGDGSTLAVSAPGDDSDTTSIDSSPNDNGLADNSGAVYVFRFDGTRWVQEAYIKPSYTGADDEFGSHIALSFDGNTLAVGSPGDDSDTTGVNSVPNDSGLADQSGAVYLFRYMAGNWTQEAYIKSANTGMFDLFGISVSLSDDGNTLAVGAEREDSATTGINTTPLDDGTAEDSGAVYLFRYVAGSWLQEAYIKPSNVDWGYFFGKSLSLSSDGNTLAVGAYGEGSSTTGINPAATGVAPYSGAVYLFRFAAGNWAQEAYIKASNSIEFLYFGYSTSLSSDGNTLAVGGPGESSNTTGTNTVPNYDNTADFSGAAYIFRFDGISWAEEAYIKASNTGANDQFGYSMALSGGGNTLAVGANFENSATTGVNSVSNDDGSADGSGAAYLLRFDGSTWVERAYIKAPVSDAGDYFGSSVSLSDDSNTLAIGAPAEDSGATGVGTQPVDNNSVSESGAVYFY